MPPGDRRDRAPPRRWALAVAAAAAVVALLAVARFTGLLGADAQQRKLEEAARLRALAAVDCERRLYTQCLHKLDTARDFDPAGDGNSRVRALREVVARDDAGAP